MKFNIRNINWKDGFFTLWNDPLVVTILLVLFLDFIYESCSG